MESWLPLGIVILLLLVPLVYGIGQYNGFVILDNHIAEAWSNIDTELKRRHDLIPNLVAVVQGYAAHERKVLETVTVLRTCCLANPGAGERQIAGENQLAQAVRDLFAVVENYPQLQADTQFLKLQKEMVHTEDRIQAARRFYNGNVRDYRNKFESFPTNLLAGLFHFAPREFLEIEPAVRENPSMDLSRS